MISSFVLSETDCHRLTANLPEPDVRDIFLLLLHTGMRRSEISVLRWSDVSFTARGLNVRSLKARRFITMNWTVHEILTRRFRGQNSADYVLGANSHCLIGKSVAIIKRVATTLGIRFSLNCLRRSAAVRLFEKGVSS
ncbi:MAG TPA: tyrosine-type recombinase/integrase [Terriglobales bacterium]|nr:tyrosine-type recombinase/integrase [Terriglobales bacterium]